VRNINVAVVLSKKRILSNLVSVDHQHVVSSEFMVAYLYMKILSNWNSKMKFCSCAWIWPRESSFSLYSGAKTLKE
jgi:hypothetical protein